MLLYIIKDWDFIDISSGSSATSMNGKTLSTTNPKYNNIRTT